MRRAAAVLIVAALIAAALLLAANKPVNEATPKVAVVAPTPTVAPPPPAVVVPPRRAPVPAQPLPARPAPTESLSVAFPALLALAQSGDVDAMLDLGMRLQHCMPFGLAREREMMVTLEREYAAAQAIARAAEPGDASLPDLASMRRGLDERRAGVAECDAIDEAQRGLSLAWVEQAAEAGSAPARTYYVAHALDEFERSSHASLVLNIDTVIERRDRARRYMRENIRQCVPRVFRQQLRGLDGALGVSEPFARAVAARAAVREADDDEDRRRSAQEVFDEAAESLDAAMRARAEQAGDAMVGRCARQD